MIKAIIFDFDDTLVKTFGRAYQRHVRAAKELNLKMPSRKKFNKNFGKPWNKVIRSLWPEVSLYRYKKMYYKLNYDDIKRFHGPPPVEGLKKTLSRLRKMGYRLFILSSRDKKSLGTTIQRLKIQSHIELYHAMEHSRYHKPDPRVFNPFYRKTKLKNKEILYVGDLVTDYDAAKKAGIAFAAVTTGMNKKKDFMEAGLNKFFILKSVNELPGFLKGWKNG